VPRDFYGNPNIKKYINKYMNRYLKQLKLFSNQAAPNIESFTIKSIYLQNMEIETIERSMLILKMNSP
jgi:hypothetical protein